MTLESFRKYLSNGKVPDETEDVDVEALEPYMEVLPNIMDAPTSGALGATQEGNDAPTSGKAGEGDNDLYASSNLESFKIINFIILSL